MQITALVIPGVEVNVVNDIASLCACDFSVFPFAAVSFRSITETLGLSGGSSIWPLRLLNRRVGHWMCLGRICHGANHDITTAPPMNAIRKTINLLLVCVKCIAVLAKHLVVSPAHIKGYRWPVAVDAGTANNGPSPSVLGGSVLLDPPVVHQAESVGGMPATALLNRAKSVCFMGAHVISNCIIPYKALGNSMAVPVMRWIGERIVAVDGLIRQESVL